MGIKIVVTDDLDGTFRQRNETVVMFFHKTVVTGFVFPHIKRSVLTLLIHPALARRGGAGKEGSGNR